MTGTDIEGMDKTGVDERNSIIQEYEAIVESLQADLKNCKEEQIRLRGEVESLQKENRTAAEVARTSFSHFNNAECPRNLDDKECVDNLKKQIALIQLERDSMFQLWQMALKTVETLENEIKTSHNDVTAHRYYEEQVNHVKETYSEAIKALESKLIQAKENFVKHQTLWESCRERVEFLNQEKSELERKIQNLQNDLLMKEETHKKILEHLNSNLEEAKRELEVNKNSQQKLETELVETRCLATRMATKDQESKAKVAEAIVLVETAMREKEMIMQREAAVLEEKSKLESHLTNIAEEFAMKLERELSECKETFEMNCKKYSLEIKELKSELREKVTLLDRAQREIQMLEEEMEKRKHGSEDFLHRSSSKVLELEQKLKDSEEKLMICEETNRRKFEEKIRMSESRILELEEKLSNVNVRLRNSQLFGSREMEEKIREADERVKEAMERYSGVEKRLTRALDERENVASELRSLQITFDREISRRENERRLLEGRIRELQEDVRNANDVADKAELRASQLNLQVENLQRELEGRKSQIIDKNEDIEVVIKDKSSNLSILREKYEERIAELTKHVKIHQKLSNKWKEEAQSLANKFQVRFKELKSKVHSLQKENEQLNNELLMCRQQVAHCRAQVMQSFDDDFR
ncbi:golgin subfamily A member 6-like protein 6 [Diachasma alloeum]|uniref:golgin subfamily A member 6-like protein 6 n=1 Tax=Diachasma alloeum TaxID=454923 RepID=UPI0007383380|nr:golgin subfamily A member 6-like protein 6 [Diachasma alloeum]